MSEQYVEDFKDQFCQNRTVAGNESQIDYKTQTFVYILSILLLALLLLAIIIAFVVNYKNQKSVETVNESSDAMQSQNTNKTRISSQVVSENKGFVKEMNSTNESQEKVFGKSQEKSDTKTDLESNSLKWFNKTLWI